MKRVFMLLLASLFVTLHSSFADDTGAVRGLIEVKNVELSKVLSLYQKYCGHELIIDSRAKRMSAPITIHISGAPPKEEVIKQFREAFLKQAGIVITSLDDKRESVTYNDALPISR